MPLTPAQQDYIETIFGLENDSGRDKIRITDIANKLGTKLPTVTRMVRKLKTMGYLEHESHGEVRLTEIGRATAGEISHLHNDLVIFFTQVLGLGKEQARRNACQLEHGFSRLAAQRLHEFLNYISELNDTDDKLFKEFIKNRSRKVSDFSNLPESKNSGWRT